MLFNGDGVRGRSTMSAEPMIGNSQGTVLQRMTFELRAFLIVACQTAFAQCSQGSPTASWCLRQWIAALILPGQQGIHHGPPSTDSVDMVSDYCEALTASEIFENFETHDARLRSHIVNLQGNGREEHLSAECTSRLAVRCGAVPFNDLIPSLAARISVP